MSINAKSNTVVLREVGPRDGLQMVASVVPTADKLRWIAAMATAGFTEMELASFVPPTSLPQMADAAAILRAVRTAQPKLTAVALAPNHRGAQNAAAAGAQVIIVPVSASEAHSRSNVRRPIAEQVAEFRRVAEWLRTVDAPPRLEAGIATAFGCSLQGTVPESEVVRLAAALAEAGADVVSLADTLGYATPSQVRRMVRAVRSEIGTRLGGLHLHDTLGTALANALAGLEEGVRHFDAALGGLGGCPFAPGSVGNAATEDLAFLLESEGFCTGVDLDALLRARDVLANILPGERLHGRLAAAGVPRTFVAASKAAPVAPTSDSAAPTLPLAGITVVEFSHMVMGPSAGMILADLGAEVIKVEPAPGGDNTRRLTGPALGFFPTFNRNKRSLCVDMKKPAGRALVRRLLKKADVLIENFRPGAMDKLGFGSDALAELNPRLIYASCKGFLPGPYEHRAALDEVVQMMGGLAYMTGPPGQPLRAGASVNDVMGGMFCAIAVLASLRERERTGRGGLVQSGLFETNMVLVAQHMASAAITGEDPRPFGDPDMPKPWPLYDVFPTAEAGRQIFVGAVTETQWRSFCEAFDLTDLRDDPALQGMRALAQGRPRIRARVAPVFAALEPAVLMARCEVLGLPFSPINRPSDLLDDPHLRASGGLLPVDLSGAEGAQGPVRRPDAGLPGLPLMLPGGRPGLRRQPPRAGEHGREIALEAGLSAQDIDELLANGTLTLPAGLAAAAE